VTYRGGSFFKQATGRTEQKRLVDDLTMAFWVRRRSSSGLHFMVYRAMHIGFALFADFLVAGVAVRVV